MTEIPTELSRGDRVTDFNRNAPRLSVGGGAWKPEPPATASSSRGSDHEQVAASTSFQTQLLRELRYDPQYLSMKPRDQRRLCELYRHFGTGGIINQLSLKDVQAMWGLGERQTRKLIRRFEAKGLLDPTLRTGRWGYVETGFGVGRRYKRTWLLGRNLYRVASRFLTAIKARAQKVPVDNSFRSPSLDLFSPGLLYCSSCGHREDLCRESPCPGGRLVDMDAPPGVYFKSQHADDCPDRPPDPLWPRPRRFVTGCARWLARRRQREPSGTAAAIPGVPSSW